MISKPSTYPLIAAFSLVLPTVSFAAEATTVNVKLVDDTSGAPQMHMMMTLDKSVVKAGDIIFKATNQSKTEDHEMIVVKDAGQALPYKDKSDRVAEKEIKTNGEISNIHPGQTKQKTFELEAGNYILICNQAEHFKKGMWARLTVVSDLAANAKPAKMDMTPPPTKPAADQSDDDDDAS